ncbi:unnamed protein product [Linum trigynum]|uniref:Retrovirus-related Pol polyprotein from transposon TNT 1-94-like beta-barrel domain-containing protein n=1 Tax=Linum trigynum TaxID=586398 RepID=A0AAV2FXD3_9ROSI
MTSSRQLFQDICPSPSVALQVADGSRLSRNGIGTVCDKGLLLKDTLYVPELVPNLIYVGQLPDNGCRITFDASGCVVQDTTTGKAIGRGTKWGRVFELTTFSRGIEGGRARVHGVHGGVVNKGGGHLAAAVMDQDVTCRGGNYDPNP